MKVFNLRCGAGHGFEGWFGSEEDFQSQTVRGLLTCPVCGQAGVTRLPSAPRLNLSGAQPPQLPGRSVAGAGPQQAAAGDQPASLNEGQRQAMEVLWLQAVKHVLANTEDVGARFADEARRIHYGDIEHRNIRGQTSPDEARALAEEGIEVFSLPLPEGLEGPAH